MVALPTSAIYYRPFDGDDSSWIVSADGELSGLTAGAYEVKCVGASASSFVQVPEQDIVSVLPGASLASSTARLPSGTGTSSNFVRWSRTRHRAPLQGGERTGFQPIICNWANNQNGDNVTNYTEQNCEVIIVTDIEGSLTQHRVTFGGQERVVIAAGEYVIADPTNVIMDAGEEYFIYFKHYPTNEQTQYPSGIPIRSEHGEGLFGGTDKEADLSTVSFSTVNSESWGVSMVFSQSVYKTHSLLGTGDSQGESYGAGGAVGDVYANRGIVGQALANQIGFFNASYRSGLAQVWQDPEEYTRLFGLLADLPEGAITHGLWIGGGNDISAGRSLAGLTGYVETIFDRMRAVGLLASAYTLFPKTTLEPVLESNATGGTSTTLIDNTQSWDADEYDGFYLTVNGQRIEIISNTATTLTVGSAFSGAFVPTTEAYEIDDAWMSEENQTPVSEYELGGIKDQYNEDLEDGTIVTDYEPYKGGYLLQGTNPSVWGNTGGVAWTSDGIHGLAATGISQAVDNGANLDNIIKYDPFRDTTNVFDLYPRRDLATVTGTDITAGTVEPSISIFSDAARAPKYNNSGGGFLYSPDGSTELETSTAVTPLETRTDVHILRFGDNPATNSDALSLGTTVAGDDNVTLYHRTDGGIQYRARSDTGFQTIDGDDNSNTFAVLIFEYTNADELKIYLNSATATVTINPHNDYFDSGNEYYHFFSRFAAGLSPENMKIHRSIRFNDTLSGAGVTAQQILDYANETFNR